MIRSTLENRLGLARNDICEFSGDIIDKFLAPVRGMFNPGDPKVHVHNMFSRDGWVCVESNSTGGLPDGKVYDNDYCWVFEVSNGKIDKMREYMDSHYTAKLFGMD